MGTLGDCLACAALVVVSIVVGTSLCSRGIFAYASAVSGVSKTRLANVNDPTKMRVEHIVAPRVSAKQSSLESTS